jgi:hypothetical protein
MKKPLYVFLHLPKTGGTTIKKHLRNNFSPEELAPVMLTWDYCHDERNKIHQKFLDMPQAEKDKLKCLYGMNVWYSIKYCFPNRDVRFITIMREPFSRAISHYRFNIERKDREKPFILQWHKNLIKDVFDPNGKIISLNTWLERINQYPSFINRYLERLGFFHESQFHFIGFVENSKKDFDYLYYLLNIKRFFEDMNITNTKIPIEITDTQKTKFMLYHTQDYYWYYNSYYKHVKFIKNNPKIKRYLKIVKRRRRRYLFFFRIKTFFKDKIKEALGDF